MLLWVGRIRIADDLDEIGRRFSRQQAHQSRSSTPQDRRRYELFDDLRRLRLNGAIHDGEAGTPWC